jgi:4-oxalocrotonate tautomerase family enzyme
VAFALDLGCKVDTVVVRSRPINPQRENENMPYLHGIIAAGRTAAQKRSLIRSMTDATERVLDVPRNDVFIFIHELATECLGYGGAEPDAATINNFTMFLREGRHLKVRAALLEALTGAAQVALSVSRPNIQILLSEIAPANIGEGGIPMGAPKQPAWFLAGRDAPLPN